VKNSVRDDFFKVGSNLKLFELKLGDLKADFLTDGLQKFQKI